ncbi:unnamed protein product [Pieris macdunnoughi]|uniref:CCHC-type domain-containing protein n=1 Tax=Pieris macdunnoughi TaxID=345717 RepID=A0A821LRK1_9NEOP|nr:unnamed protein product [Pieris macdunnoughi]
MSTNSNSFCTYAIYARLRIVRGLSDDLITDIVLRGINDPQVKAAATNANLSPDKLVNYLSKFMKPDNSYTKPVRRLFQPNSISRTQGNKRPVQAFNASIKRFHYGEQGHKQVNYSKKPKIGTAAATKEPVSSKPTGKADNAAACAYCKKTGHHIRDCFTKQ